MTARAPGDELIGTTVGDCRIERLLARGGMSLTFEARHEHLAIPAVVKMLDPRRAWGKPELVAAFLREARALGAVTHPHVVRVISAGQHGDTPYLVLEHVGGGSLRARLREDDVDPEEVVALLVQAGEGLGAAHARGIVHGDIKPENLLLDAEGALRVVDFGLARASGQEDDGALYGTPAYLAPERCRGQPPDPSADVYALGVTLYECLAGRWPFNAPEPRLLLRKHLEEAPPREPLAEVVDDALADFTLACLSKDPTRRPRDGAAFAAALRAAAAREEPARRRRPRRRRSAAALRRVSSGRHAAVARRAGGSSSSSTGFLVAALLALAAVVALLAARSLR